MYTHLNTRSIHTPPYTDDGASERSALVHLYGKQFVAVRPELALEYYMLAAAIEVGGGGWVYGCA